MTSWTVALFPGARAAAQSPGRPVPFPSPLLRPPSEVLASCTHGPNHKSRCSMPFEKVPDLPACFPSSVPQAVTRWSSASFPGEHADSSYG